MRAGKWKLHMTDEKERYWGEFHRDGDHIKSAEPMLYDLENDIGETKNLAKDHPEVVARLMKHIEFARKDIGDGDKIGENAR